MDEKELSAEDLEVVEQARQRSEGAGIGRLLFILLALAFGAVAALVLWGLPALQGEPGARVDDLIGDFARHPPLPAGGGLQFLVDGIGWLLTALVWLVLGTAGRADRRRDAVLVKLADLRARDLDLPR